jgi:lysozyme
MTLNGIDISHWQGGMDVGRTGADFVIVKVTDGTSYKDPQAVTFARQIIDAGMLGGGYHFWQAGQSATAQADHFLSVVEPVVGRAVMVLDWESSDTGNVAGAKAWLDHVYERTGIRPVIYMSQSVAASHDWSSVAAQNALWVARYGTSTYGDTGAWADPVMWQHTSSGRVPGYSGNVDLDYFYGTAETWRALAAGDSNPNPAPAPEDDMPEWKNMTYGPDWSFTADGEWRTLRLGEDDDGATLYNFLSGPKRTTGELNVTLTGLAKGHEVNLRPVVVEAKEGQDTKVATEFPATEFFAGSSGTAIGIPFTQDIIAGSDGISRRLRFQIRAWGGEKVTVTGVRTRALYWDR